MDSGIFNPPAVPDRSIEFIARKESGEIPGKIENQRKSHDRKQHDEQDENRDIFSHETSHRQITLCTNARNSSFQKQHIPLRLLYPMETRNATILLWD
jgi:hypothetical protein